MAEDRRVLGRGSGHLIDDVDWPHRRYRAVGTQNMTPGRDAVR